MSELKRYSLTKSKHGRYGVTVEEDEKGSLYLVGDVNNRISELEAQLENERNIVGVHMAENYKLTEELKAKESELQRVMTQKILNADLQTIADIGFEKTACRIATTIEAKDEQLAALQASKASVDSICKKVNEQIKEIKTCIERGYDKKWSIKAFNDLSVFISNLSEQKAD